MQRNYGTVKRHGRFHNGPLVCVIVMPTGLVHARPRPGEIDQCNVSRKRQDRKQTHIAENIAQEFGCHPTHHRHVAKPWHCRHFVRNTLLACPWGEAISYGGTGPDSRSSPRVPHRPQRVFSGEAIGVCYMSRRPKTLANVLGMSKVDPQVSATRSSYLLSVLSRSSTSPSKT